MKPYLLIAALAASALTVPLTAAASGSPYSVQGARNAATRVCETKGSTASCVEVAPAADNGDLLGVTRVNMGLRSPATWVETRVDSYQLCAVDAAFERQCEKLAIPHLRGTHLSTKSVAGYKTKLQLSFSTANGLPTAASRRTLGDTFLLELNRSRDALATGLGHAHGAAAVLAPSKSHHDLFPRTASLVTTNDDCSVDAESRPRGGPTGPTTEDTGDCGGGGGGGGDDGGDGGSGGGSGGGGGDDGGDGVVLDPQTLACYAACYALAEARYAYCGRASSTPQDYAICMGLANEEQASCIQGC